MCFTNRLEERRTIFDRSCKQEHRVVKKTTVREKAGKKLFAFLIKNLTILANGCILKLENTKCDRDQ
jgi:aminopeptidase-like protein